MGERRNAWVGVIVWLVWVGTSAAQDNAERHALDLFQAGESERATAAFQRLLNARPNDPVALYHLGRLATDGTSARQYYLRLLQHAPRHPYADDALLAVVQWQYADGQYQDAVQTCTRLLASYPDTDVGDQARYWLGRTLFADDELTLARLTFYQLLNVYPHSPYVMRTRLGIAETFRAEGAFTEAVKAYLKLEADFPDGDSLRVVLFRAGQCLEAAGKRSEAQHVYRRLLTRFPSSPEATAARDRLPAPVPVPADARATADTLTPPLPPVTHSLPLSSSGPYYTIHVGTFKNRSRAEGLLERLKQTGIDGQIMAISDREQTRYRVLAGRFTAKDQATAAAKKLKREKVIEDYRVVRM